MNDTMLTGTSSNLPNPMELFCILRARVGHIWISHPGSKRVLICIRPEGPDSSRLTKIRSSTPTILKRAKIRIQPVNQMSTWLPPTLNSYLIFKTNLVNKQTVFPKTYNVTIIHFFSHEASLLLGNTAILQPLTTAGWRLLSADALGCCLALIPNVFALSSSVQRTVVMFYHFAKHDEWFQKR